MQKKYIDPDNILPKLPIVPGLVFWIALDHFNAPSESYVILSILLIFFSARTFARWFTSEVVDMFDEDRKDI